MSKKPKVTEQVGGRADIKHRALAPESEFPPISPGTLVLSPQRLFHDHTTALLLSTDQANVKFNTIHTSSTVCHVINHRILNMILTLILTDSSNIYSYSFSRKLYKLSSMKMSVSIADVGTKRKDHWELRFHWHELFSSCHPKCGIGSSNTNFNVYGFPTF